MSNPPRPSRRRGTLLIVLAALVPLCFTGWLVWQSVQGDADARGPAPELVPGPEGSGEPEANGRESPAPSRSEAAPEKPLAGRTVVIDPGHNPNNRDHPQKIAEKVDIGAKRKACDTTGTVTRSGYAEASFTLDVAHRIRKDLRARGATVRLTQDGDRPYGPCIDERAALGNTAKADAVVSVHADGAGTGHRGFHVIAPESVHEGEADTRKIARPSRRLGEALVKSFGRATGSATAGYAGGGDGLVTRGDLGGLNLSRVPKVFIECGNMRDPQDAGDLTDAAWRERAAHGIAAGITGFLTGRQP